MRIWSLHPQYLDARGLATRSLVLLFWLTAATPVLCQPGEPPRPRAAGTAREGDIPGYVSRALAADAPDWLRLGAEVRARFEDRAGLQQDPIVPGRTSAGVTRTRVFAGFGRARGPVRFAVEMQDSRQFGASDPPELLTINEADLLQARLTVDLEAIAAVPIAVDLGRIAFDGVDRRLIARNRHRNTTNAFDGARVRIGREQSAVVLEGLVLWPTELLPERLDPAGPGQRLLGMIGYLRQPWIVIEPYYLHFDAQREGPRTLHTTGVRLFGPLAARWDHDVHVSTQFGTAEGRRHRALALHAEAGRRLAAPWSPRLAGWLNYASGDADPHDARSGRFDPLFGSSHSMFGFTDLLSWENTVSPAVGLTFSPRATLNVALAHRVVWLASERDGLVSAGVRDPTGRSGAFVGQELDVRVRWALLPAAELDVQYGRLFAGGFLKRSGHRAGARIFLAAITAKLP